jgi:NADPH:quinone reductase-like Zn-dependent oxidoreductase
MRAWHIESFGKLTCSDIPEPVAGPGQLLVAVRAVSLNFRDHLMVGGLYDSRLALPLIPGSDCCGVVVSGGEGTNTAVGTRVVPSFNTLWTDGPLTDAVRPGTLGGPVSGVFAQRIVVPEDSVIVAPKHLTDAEAATLPCAGVTAWRALVTDANVGPDMSVLTLGTGGVSVFAVQLATALGARVAVTSSSDAKLEQMRELGAVHTVNYRTTPKWGRAIREWQPVDVVVELGGAGTLKQSLAAIKTGGHIALIGVLDGGGTEVPLTQILMRAIRVQGVFVGSRADLAALADFLVRHPEVRPVIDHVATFDDLGTELIRLATGQHVGKVVVAF